MINNVTKDVVVIGGGLAGICSAIAAARHGVSVALVQNRSVLGGNSSSEIRVWACGAGINCNRFAEETGIIGELFLENLYRNSNGNPHIWDSLLLDSVLGEHNIDLFLDTNVYSVGCSNQMISSVMAIQNGSGRTYEINGKMFIDCTGDAFVGNAAGARTMKGREGRRDFKESLAPYTADQNVLGSSLFYYVKDTGKYTKFVAPGFAYKWQEVKDLFERTGKRIKPGMHGCDLWWLEFGGMLDTIEKNDTIRFELTRLAYGIWDYIKNSGEFASDTLDLEWIGSLPGKRESKRILGIYVLTQDDITQQRGFKDTVCYGGWPIDTHPPEGIFSLDNSCTQIPANIYEIPLGCLCSKDIRNLFFAGRDASVTHIALASTRVMKTCALMGQAVGTSAAMSVGLGRYPADFTDIDIKNLQQQLLKDDCWIPGIRNIDPDDIAKKAIIKTSGFKNFSSIKHDGNFWRVKEMTLFLPAIERLDSIRLMLEIEEGSEVNCSIYLSDTPRNYKAFERYGETHLTGQPGGKQWYTFDLMISNPRANNIILSFSSVNYFSVYTAEDKCTGVFSVEGGEAGIKSFFPCFMVSPEVDIYQPENVINGFSRPYGMPNLWVSEDMRLQDAILELEFQEETNVGFVLTYFNPDLNRRLINIQKPDYYDLGWDKMPEELVKDFSIICYDSVGLPVKSIMIEENRKRLVKIRFEPCNIKRMQLQVNKTWGSNFAEVFEIRVYPAG